MDPIDAVLLGEVNDSRDVEIGADWLADIANAIRLVGLETMQGKTIFVRVESDRADAEFVGRAENANGNFAAIGNEQFVNGAQRRCGSILRHVHSSREAKGNLLQ